ncbi:sensor histidine kinase [Microbacterium elymi]|uniref:sensor histidine kinase n=1 Tax=Microbacterium elymi TaxID=2909587 RepID=UPI00338DB508
MPRPARSRRSRHPPAAPSTSSDQLLETLRSDDLDTAATTLGLAALSTLVDESTGAGVPTTLTVIGDPRPVPDTVQVSLYRIAQEALTNARRHAGPDATADVRLRYHDAGDTGTAETGTADIPGGAGIELEVTNTGRRVARVGRGLGLVGMRERAAACGGRLEARPRDGDGFLVRISVPLAVHADAGADAGA